MKKLFLMFAVVTMSLTALAQTTRTIKGAVIDKSGNPLPGATVEATGGSDITTVDADGTFSLEAPIWLKKVTARYAGLQSNTMKVKDGDIIFQMSNSKKKQWYIIANYSHIFCDDRLYYNEHFYGGNMGGLMWGFIGKWGWYMKLNAGVYLKSYRHYYYSYQDYRYSYDYYSYHKDDLAITFTTGVSKRITDFLHVYMGLGVGKQPDHDASVVPEIGFIGKFKKHLLLNLSYQCIASYRPDPGHVVNVGIGYAF